MKLTKRWINNLTDDGIHDLYYTIVNELAKWKNNLSLNEYTIFVEENEKLAELIRKESLEVFRTVHSKLLFLHKIIPLLYESNDTFGTEGWEHTFGLED